MEWPVLAMSEFEPPENEWIALIDADDLWETDKLELQWKASKLCPEAAVVLDDPSKDGEYLILYRG
jgi:glycosyltransferase involved in cell wall biosynthesis